MAAIDMGECIYCDSSCTIPEYLEGHAAGRCVGAASVSKALMGKVEKARRERIEKATADRREASRLRHLAETVGDRELAIEYARRARALEAS
jgi:hypothetical protein